MDGHPETPLQFEGASAVPIRSGGPDLLNYMSAIRGYFAKRVAPHDVDDMVQEVALRLQQRTTREGIDNVEAYLFHVARTVIIDRNRRDVVRHRTGHDSLEDRNHPVEERSPERIAQGKQELAQLIAALDVLPVRAREAFLLHRFEEMSYRDIANQMGISVSAVEKHIMNAMRHLLRRFPNG